MRSNSFKSVLIKSGLAACVLALGSGVAFGQTVAASASGTVDVGASVITAALTLNGPIDPGFSLSGAAAPFTVSDPNGCATGGVTTSCALSVTFSPTATGTATDPVTVSGTSTSGGVTTPFSVVANLSGSGALPQATPGQALTFQDFGPGKPSTQTVTVNLTNSAEAAAFAFTAAVNGNTSYAVSGGTCLATSPVSLGAGNPASCTVIVTYTPLAAVDPSGGTLAVSYSYGAASPTQIAQLTLADQNPPGTAVAAAGGNTVEVELIAASTSVTLNDGTNVPMWGYQCTNSLACAQLNPTAGNSWSPVVITVVTGQTLAIDLTNNLSFASGANAVPTSLVIVGQVGGGLGNTATATPSPAHGTQSPTWIGGGNATFTPPPQGPRVQSFSTEVAAGATTRLTWTNLRPGTYLLESGTHPSIQVPMGLYGIVVVTAPPTATAGKETASGCAYPGATAGTCAAAYDAEVAMLLSEIDPVQNNRVSSAVATAGFSETKVWSGLPGACGDLTPGAAQTCYPPAVNYTPLYYLINGVAFDKTNAANSLFQVSPGTIAPASGAGSVLVRVVNAGLRMHVPAIVGSQVAGATGGSNPIVTGFQVIAEDGRPLPGVPKVKSEVFMAAGKTFDLMINAQTTTPGTPPTFAAYPSALPIFDRELSLSGNAVARDAGMLAYIGFNGTGLPVAAGAGAFAAAVARADTYNALVPGQTLTVSNPAKGVIANDTNVYGVRIQNQATSGTVTLNANGTFAYVPNTGSMATADSFSYCANGSTSTCATVTLGASNIADSGVTCTGTTFSASTATYHAVKTPGVLAGCTDGANLPLTVDTSTVTATGMTVLADVNGGFTAIAPSAGTYMFSFQAQNSQKTHSATTTVTVVFPTGSGLAVNVLDGYDHVTPITDYRWVIEEDRTFYVDPNCQTNPPAAGCPTANSGIVPTLGVNFHTSYMPFVAQGCTGSVSCEAGQSVQGNAVVCDVSNGACRPDTTGNGMTAVMPSQVHLDPTKRYYISILPGDAANPFQAGYTGIPCGQPGAPASGCSIGHGMGGAPVAAGQTAVTVLTQPAPFPPAKLSVFVFEDDFPLNGEQDGGGGVDVLSPQEPGLGGFQIHLWDAMGGNGDFTGQMTYDMFNQPLTNSLAGTIDPSTGKDACPIGVNELSATAGWQANNPNGTPQTLPTNSDRKTLQTDPTATGITGMIVTCPKYESDGKTLSPLAGQAVIANLMPGRWGAIATPGADRIARGEEWLQTNTLDGQKAHDVFTRIGEPSYFQEFGPASYHVSIGFANPAIINARKQFLCSGQDPSSPQPGIPYNCNNTITGKVTGEHLSRTPDERLYSTGSHDTYYWTQCYVSFGDPDGEDFAFTKCAADGTFTLSNLPPGDWRVTVFDQWNDGLVDGLSTPIGIAGGGQTINMGDIATTQWQANLYTRTFIDDNKDGISQSTENGIPFANVAVRLRDGSLENLLVTDFTGTANFNETFPLFSWYVVETDVTRYKNTGTHVVYDVGGPVDGSASCGTTGYPPCGTSTIGAHLANTAEIVSVPANLRIPGAVYCAGADCSGKSIQNGPSTSDSPSVCTTSAATATAPPLTTCSTQLSSGRIDPPWAGGVEGWQGFPGQNNFLEFGKAPYYEGENGGIKGHVIYASTRPFDDPQMLVQTQWEPLVPHVTMNLYQEGFAADGVTPTLTLVDTTTTSSWDDFAQGFHVDAKGNTIPNMSCPGQGGSSGAIPDLFYFSLYNQPQYLDFYNNVQHGTAGNPTPLPNNSQFKCYDGMHNWNQLQPAPYDGMYQFPSVTSTDPTTGKPAGTNCKICVADPVPASGTDADALRHGLPMLPPGKYVVEVVLPPGYELVKEEDKNILIGDDFIAPVTQEFGGLANIFIIPDQASVAGTYSSGSGYNANSPTQNPTQSLGAAPNNWIVPGFVPEPTWPCVGEARVVPDYISLYPQTKQVAPFAGATRNLCDRKEVTLGDQMGAIAKFYVFTSTHIASKFTGGITDDYTSEFDPFSPQFGEKFAPPNLPVSLKDWAGNETNRVYADHWGAYNGMTYSTWEVNPPNPTGYSPTMMVVCMNDPGPIPGPGGTMITDPAYTVGYSQFCYELPFMPGTTQYLDTPVVPTSAFAGAGYNNVDCAYPDATPGISEVDGDQVGPWVSTAGNTLTITALGDQLVPNNAYSGPTATTAPFNQRTIKRHYGFGSCTLLNGACTNGAKVTIGGQPATITGWSDSSITVTAPSGVANCPVQQQAQYVPAGTTSTQCGQLVVTAANGKQSVDAVTVTVGGKAPTHVAASASLQDAIDLAAPGDLLIIDPTCNTATNSGVDCMTPSVTTKTTAAHNELLLMWKPVRLQGVGAASSILNANTHPAGKITTWRQKVNCLFGLSLQGTFLTATNAYDPSGVVSCPWTTSAGQPLAYFQNYSQTLPDNAQVDPIPGEAVLGWDATLNGNLAQLLQEPSLMGALEGAGITVLAKGVNFPSGGQVGQVEGTFPAGTTLLTGYTVDVASGAYATGDTNTNCTSGTGNSNPFPSNFSCNPSSIDGLGITDSSQGGGGVFVHGWAHNLQIANNRINSNAGTLSGGINIGQGEFSPQQIAGAATLLDPGSCVSSGVVTNQQLPYCENLNVNIHNNNISLNSSTGDELFSATPAGAGGISICTGSDYYKFNYNWVCGNLSSGDGGGVGHLGMSYNGDIEHNSILFNQSLNPTVPANGGGLLVMGTPDIVPPCGATTDQDCVPTAAQGGPASILPSDGVGPNLVINANLIMGNAAESGSGGGLRLQNVNGADVLAFPTTPSQWWSPTVTNNIIADNLAGWDGAGISLLDALNVNIINNTVVSNSTTASAGILFTTIGAPLASSEGKNCIIGTETSCPQISGLVAIQNSSVLHANLPAKVTCPAGHFAPGTGANNGTCRNYSYPMIENNIFWQNSTYYIGVGALSAQYQQSVVSLYNAFTSTLAPSQPQTSANTPNGAGVIITGGTGACVAASYWDIGARGDTGPTNHSSGVTLSPRQSILTSVAGYGGNGNSASNPTFVSQYCDGSRTPPEFGTSGWAVPAGVSDATVPNPIFNLTPVATVDEGNNWINLRWGPLSLLNPTTNVTLGNYGLAAGSPAIDSIPATAGTYGHAPPTDFFGNPRPDMAGTPIDVGAVEFQRPATPLPELNPSALSFGNQLVGTQGPGQTITLTNYGGGTVTLASFTLSPQYNLGGATTCANGTALPAGSSCIFRVRFLPTGTGAVAGTLSVTTNPGAVVLTSNLTGTGVGLTSIAPNSGFGGTVVPVTITGVGLSGATGVNVSGTGITVSNFGPVVSDTTVTATFTITSTAGAGARNVTVILAGGVVSNAVTFTVQGPILTSIAPNTGVRGTTVPVTLTGTNLTGTSAVTVSGAGVTCPISGTPTATTVSANCTITGGAALGATNVTVTTLGGTSNFVTFTVLAPTLSSIAPTSGVRGTTVPVTLTGTNLSGATAVTVSGGGVSCGTIVVSPDGTTVTANCSITAGAGLTARNVTVTTPGGTTNTLTGAFTVTGATVTFAGPAPALNSGGTGTKTGTITVSNAAAATGPLTLTANPTVATTGGTGNGTFSVTGGTCSSGSVVAPGGSCTIIVQYAGQTNTATANGRVTITGTGLAAATLTSPTFPAN